MIVVKNCDEEVLVSEAALVKIKGDSFGERTGGNIYGPANFL
jgi:hypothetical protein